uniref:Uncharacterized protein n=1 Tax=Anguilla anguilla TaxID=7936 RepID=A0A0E9RU04_ANGAN
MLFRVGTSLKNTTAVPVWEIEPAAFRVRDQFPNHSVTLLVFLKKLYFIF